MILCTKTEVVVVINHAMTGLLARKEREGKGLSLRKVAKRMGVSATYVSDLELGKRNWNSVTAFNYNQALKKP